VETKDYLAIDIRFRRQHPPVRLLGRRTVEGRATSTALKPGSRGGSLLPLAAGGPAAGPEHGRHPVFQVAHRRRRHH